jgi:hypothetical protein
MADRVTQPRAMPAKVLVLPACREQALRPGQGLLKRDEDHVTTGDRCSHLRRPAAQHLLVQPHDR